MAISPDGGHLAVLCHSGFLHVLSLKPEDAGADPYRIGAGALRELWSTLFWKESPGTWVW